MKIDFPRLAAAALQQAETLLSAWLPGGKRARHEYKAINPTRSDSHEGSFLINMATGAWADFATSDRGGDLVSLYAYLFHGGNQGAAAAELSKTLGMDVAPPPKTRRKRPLLATPAPAEALEPTEPDWVWVSPVPPDAPPPPKAHIKRGLPDTVWTYRDATGGILGYIYRFSTPDGGKDITPLTYWRHTETGKTEWKWRVFPEPRPLYGLDRLAARPLAIVLIVEGEKCADAAQAELPDLVVIAWPGGCAAVDRVDWQPLIGRQVITFADADSQREKCSKAEKEAGVDPASKPYLLPDDQPGYRAMAKIRGKLAGHCKIWDVQIPEPGDAPSGFDVADMIAAGMTGAALADWIRQHAQLVETQPAAQAGAGKGRKAAAARNEQWWAGLRERRGELVDSLANVFDILSRHPQWHDVVSFDEFSCRTIKRKPPPFGGEVGEWSDNDDSQTAMWLDRAAGLITSSMNVAKVIEVLARANPTHPVREWLASLPSWDGVRRNHSWLQDFVGVADSEYVQRVGCYFLRGMIARVMEPGCKFDYCLVLEGPQGKGKSTVLRTLVGEWFADTDLDLHNKDAMAALGGVWLYEFPELSSVSRAEAAKQKSFLSRQTDKYRPAYGHRAIVVPRQVVFAGSINDWEWNKDPTGGRRFWPVECAGEINIEGLLGMREQLFAEALADYKAGRRFWPTHEEQAALFDIEQLRREQPDSLIDALHDWVFRQIAPFSVAMAVLDGMKLTPDKLTRDFSTRVGIALRKLGCKRTEKRNGMVRFWWTPPTKKDGDVTEANHMPTQQQYGNGGDYAPF